jgi:TPR repeat protein
LNASLEPDAGSALSRAVGAAKPVRIPDAFWELPQHTNQALFFDASLLAPLFELSPRTQALLAEAGGKGSLVEQLLSVPAACGQPGQAWALAWANQLDRATKPAAPEKPSLPELAELRPPETPAVPSYALLGIEDARGGCGKALRALLAAHDRLAAVAGQAADKRHLSTLLVDKPLPQTLKLLKLGSGEASLYVALAERKGVLWIASSSDLSALKSGLTDLLVPGPKRRGLRSRADLAELGKAPGLVSGFVRQDSLPFASLGMPKRRASDAAQPADSEVRRMAFAVTRDRASLRVTAQIEALSLRLLLARGMADNLGAIELSKLPAAKVAPALAVLEASCHLGGADGCNALGVTYGDGRGVPKDAARAVSWLELGCQQGSGMACANLVFYKTMGKEEELRLFQKSCELDTPFGCAWWGVKLLDRDKPGDQQQGFEKLAAACNQNAAFACARIGNHYQEGVGLPHDDAKGADFHDRACDLGMGVGCVGVASALAAGKGRAKDAPLAFRYLQRACKLDQEEGCYALGLAYLYGEITPKNEAAARQELGVACEANHAEACRVLAELAGEP